MDRALSGQTQKTTGNRQLRELELKINEFLTELDDFYILRPIMAENCDVTMTELDTIYSFHGLCELHIMLDIKSDIARIEEAKIEKPPKK